MVKLHKAYVAIVLSLGVVALCFCFYGAIPYFFHANVDTWLYVLIIVGLTAVCRMLPIDVGGGRKLDMSFVPVLACAMTSSYAVAVVLHFASSMFNVVKEPRTGKFYSPLFRTPVREFFNTANISISTWIAGIIVSLFHPDPSHFFSLRMIILFLLFTAINIVIEYFIFITYYLSNGQKTALEALWRNFRLLLPNTLCTIPIAFMVGILLVTPNGYLFIILLMAPLLMARYSFKMYLDTRSMNLRTIAALSNAIETKDQYTQGHSRRVAFYSEAIARALKKPRAYTENIRTAALLHDIGKIGINDSVLMKEGPLARSEFAEIQQHPSMGYKIIRTIHFPNVINDGVLYHHLRYDLSGYPQETKLPKKLPLSAAILAVADAYDAMTSDRPYRKGIDPEEALSIIQKQAGVQFAPEVVGVFTSILPQLDTTQLEMDFEQELEAIT